MGTASGSSSAGFDGYMSKPVNVRDLIETVREHCDRGSR